MSRHCRDWSLSLVISYSGWKLQRDFNKLGKISPTGCCKGNSRRQTYTRLHWRQYVGDSDCRAFRIYCLEQSQKLHEMCRINYYSELRRRRNTSCMTRTHKEASAPATVLSPGRLEKTLCSKIVAIYIYVVYVVIVSNTWLPECRITYDFRDKYI